MSDKIDYDKAFEGCTSNLDAPLMGRIITPTCYQCKNQVEDKDPFKPNTCKVFGKLPEKYAYDDKEDCPHKVIAKKLSWPLTEEQQEALLAKREYNREHPEEAHEEWLNRKDDGVVIVTPPKAQTTIDPSWKDEFAPHILARGEKYFEEGRISCIQRMINTYIADVAGTYEYEVEITIEDGGIKEMRCSCPYAETKNCKHMAALLFSLSSKEPPVEEIPPAKQPPIVAHVPVEMPWLEAIDHLPEDVIRKELLKRADRDERLKERLAVLYLGKLPEGQLQNWKADLQETAGEYTDRRGRIRDEDSWDFLNDLSNFLAAKLPLLFEVGAVMDVFYLIWIVMETALEWEIDDPDDEIGFLFADCEEALRKNFSMATQTKKEQMLRWYQEHRNENWPGNVELMDYIFRTLTNPQPPVFEKRVMKHFDDAPYYLCEGEWIPFPYNGFLYYDVVENTTAYKEAVSVVEEEIKKNLGELYGEFGSCHAIWHQKKQLLMEQYGIEWFSPAELNRNVIFD